MLRKGLNREKTFEAVVAIMRHFEENSASLGSGDGQTFASLPIDRKIQLAMQFYQCERGRYQKAKMLFDTFTHTLPLIISLAALWMSTR